MIRAFTESDIGKVADLWIRANRGGQEHAPEDLKRYCRNIYFDSPWSSPDWPSLVYEESDGRITGFHSLFHRRYLFDGRPINAAIAAGTMVDPAERGRGIGFAMRQRAFEGPQELTLCDGANVASRRLWLAAGGETCMMQSCVWTRVLRPGVNLLGKLRSRAPLRRAAPLCRPLAALIDWSGRRAAVGPYQLGDDTTRSSPASAAEILKVRADCDASGRLCAEYDEQSLDWLLSETATATKRGNLECAIVHEDDGEPFSCYVCFMKRGGVSEVMQMGGEPTKIGRVLNHLFHRARAVESTAVSGRFDARFADQLAAVRCSYGFVFAFVVHSRDSELRLALHSGDTSLSRLDGEWWMHFVDGPWA